MYQNYNAKTLFQGWRIGLRSGKLYVGVPNTKGGNVLVTYKGEKMRITDEQGLEGYSEWLPDKTYQNNGKDYRLGYYEWIPMVTKISNEPTIIPVKTELSQGTLLDIRPERTFR